MLSKFTQCKEIYSIEPFEIAILQSVLEWQHEKGDWSKKNADFSTLIGCLEGLQKAK